MTDRFRGQDPDSEYSSEDEYGSQDQMSSAMHDEPPTRQGSESYSESESVSGDGVFAGQDEYGSGMDDGTQNRRAGAGPGRHALEEDEMGDGEPGSNR